MRAAIITQPGSVEIATVDDPAPDPRGLPLAAFPDAIARFQAGLGRKIQIQPGLASA